MADNKPKIGATVSKEQAKLLPASAFELQRLCERLNRRGRVQPRRRTAA